MMALMTNGVGNLIGYLGTGWWFNACTQTNGTQWQWFWGGLAVVIVLVQIYFLTAYHGKYSGTTRPPGSGPVIKATLPLGDTP